MSKFLAWCRNPNKRKRNVASIHALICHLAFLLKEDGVSHPRAYSILRRTANAMREDTRFIPDREILSAIQYAFECAPATGAPRSRPWPVPNRALMAECRRQSKRRGWTLETLRSTSPQDEPEKVAPRAILEQLLGAEVLVCIGKGVHDFQTLPLKDAPDLARWEFVVPSAMSALAGKRKSDGELSAHTLDNTGPRQYLVIEFDDGATFDEQAARHIWLSEFRPLRLVVHSGSKSLHGWYEASDEVEDRRFMEEATRLGADSKTWLKSQFVRMPNGKREKTKPQHVYFY